MKHRLLCAVCLLLMGYTAMSQQFITQVKPVDSKLWGYANEKGEIIIPAQFSKCYKFSREGLAAIYDTKERQYYFINTKGEKLQTEISDFKLPGIFGFDVSGFRDGLVPVKKNDKWGYLNTTGKLAIPIKYDDASDFNGGFASAKSGDKFFVLNTKGEEFAVADAGVTDVKEFSEGLAPYRAKDKTFGFIGRDGKIAIAAQFESVGYFTNGLAWAKSGDGKLGYIDPKGQWVIKPQYSAGKEFDKETGLARVRIGDKWGYVNKAGDVRYIDDTKVWSDFSEGLADGEKNEKRGFYDATGKWVIDPQFDAVRDFKNGFAAAKMGDKWGVINKQGKWVIQPTFEGIKDMELVSR